MHTMLLTTSTATRPTTATATADAYCVASQ